MQEEVTQKTIALYVKVGKGAARLTEQALQKAIQKFLEQKSKPAHGKQTMRQLMKQNAGVSNIEITDANIKAFESTAKKYNIDFSLKKVKGEQTRYLVFFKGRDADVMTAAFQEFSAKKLNREKKPSIRKALAAAKDKAKQLMEQMFFVIDSRYRSRRPMIITTNLKLSELKKPPDLAHARIYDRILERCAPILFDGKNFREENAGATRQTAKDIVNSKQD